MIGVMIIRCPSGSEIKLSAINAALREVYADKDFQVTSFPVELQDRSDLDVNAEPEGKEQTLKYARERLRQMYLRHGPTSGIDISIESGIIDGLDVACVIITTKNGESALVWSQGVAVPEGAFEEARARGLKTTSVGDIIHEKHPAIPANNWEGSFPPYVSRQQQIQTAVISALLQMPDTK
jgi:non-canonical (house-cleaning) NTP pyrophosphatase